MMMMIYLFYDRVSRDTKAFIESFLALVLAEKITKRRQFLKFSFILCLLAFFA